MQKKKLGSGDWERGYKLKSYTRLTNTSAKHLPNLYTYYSVRVLIKLAVKLALDVIQIVALCSCLSLPRRLSDIFRKGRRHFRKSLSRSRSEEEAGHSQAPPLNPTSHHHHHHQGTTTEGHPPMPGRSASLGTGIGTGTGTGSTGRPSSGGASSGSGRPPGRPLSREGASGSEELTAKERIQQWIQKQSREFMDQWYSSAENNPALDVVKRLSESTEQLEYQSPSCLPALSVSGRKGDWGGGEGCGGEEEGCGGEEEGCGGEEKGCGRIAEGRRRGVGGLWRGGGGVWEDCGGEEEGLRRGGGRVWEGCGGEEEG